MRRQRIPRIFRLLAILGLLPLSFAFATVPVMAAELRTNSTIVVGATEVVNEDLYAFANNVTIDGTIKGDLVTAAGVVTINGTVEGDVLGAAQTLIINGTVGETARVAAAVIQIGPNARVNRDVAGAGASIEQKAGSIVRGDMLIGAYQALLAGEIGRNVQGGMMALDLRGNIGGDVNVEVTAEENGVTPIQFVSNSDVTIPQVAPHLTLADSARIKGKLTYTSMQEAVISPAAQVSGGIEQTILPPTAAAITPRVNPLLVALRHLLALLLVGLLLIWLMPTWVRRRADDVQARALPTLGWGFAVFAAFLALVFLVLPLVIMMIAGFFGLLTLGRLVLLTVSTGLLAEAALIISFFVFVSYVAQIIMSYLVGRWLLQRVQAAWVEQPFVPLAVGLVLYVILAAIPWLGALTNLLVACFALGAALDWVRELSGRSPRAPAPFQRLQPI